MCLATIPWKFPISKNTFSQKKTRIASDSELQINEESELEIGIIQQPNVCLQDNLCNQFFDLPNSQATQRSAWLHGTLVPKRRSG